MKKICIVCGSKSSEHLAPFDDDDYEIWVLASRVGTYKGKRVDRIFEIHGNLEEAYVGLTGETSENIAKYLKSLNIPLVVSDKFPTTGEHVEVFPYEEADELFGSTYLTSSVAYMMAYAVLHGAEHISLYGVDMTVDDDEYFRQRPCVEAWIGFAKGRGIEVYLPDVSPVLKSDYLYGSGKLPVHTQVPFTQSEFSILAKQHNDEVEAIREQITELKLKMNAHAGAHQAYERMTKICRALESGVKIDNLTDSVVIK